ncbi:hypothetical protein LWI28_005637 [Acer negundo]|uniref:RING-type domain-containing protein n=1 Tax=Acer negundo TaxID=4023 RepID=A0AAD5ID68_ACENE|nr:hypothetical protein LWI28_005637 [Acer negundo]KAK4839551.1 hypothetical protein QYF36_022753 [Acer negundo]
MSMEAEATIPTLIMIMVVLVYSLFHYLYSTKSKWYLLADHEENNNGNDDDEEDEDVDCAVCLSKLVCDGDTFRVLKACKHGFHGHCIDAWLKLHSTCPLCRANVVVIPSSSKHQAVAGGLFCFWSNMISDLLLTSISKWMDNIMISLDDELKMAVCANFTSIN